MWDFLTSSQLWRTSFSKPVSNISIDPFNRNNAIFLCDDSSILMIDDLQPRAAPSQKYRRINFYGATGPSKETVQPGEDSGGLRRNSSSLNKFINMTTSLITGSADSRSSRKSVSEDDKTSQCLQVVYHPGIRHVVFMVYPTQVDIIDVEVCIVVSTIRLDSKSSLFVRVLPCKQKDVLYCLHENGCITIRVRRQDKSHCTYTESQRTQPSTPVSQEYVEAPSERSDIAYDLIWQSDAVHLSNQSTVYGFCVHPGSETGAALIFSDGKILLWELVNTRDSGWILEDVLPGLSVKGQKNLLMDGNRFLLTGMIKGFPSYISTIKSNLQKPLTTKNGMESKPKEALLALGLDNGAILILDIQTGHIERELSVHSNTVKGIEWLYQDTLFSWTCSRSGGSSSMGRNEILLTTIQSGMVEVFRHRNKLESIITDIKVSPLRQYAVISFKAQGLEVWCLQTKSLLREMHDKFHHPRALTWAPTCTWKTVVIQRTPNVINKDFSEMSQADIHNLLHDRESRRVAREQCVLANRDGAICRITLEERAISDLTIFPPEVNGMSSVTHIAMKDDIMILGDVTGALYLMNTSKKTMKSAPKPYSGMRTILFHPTSSDHRFAVLYDQGMDVWMLPQNQDQLKLLRLFKHNKSTPKIQSMEWADLNHISMVMDDGSIHIVDITSSKITCSWIQRNLMNTEFCPHTLPAQASTLLKYLLQNASSPDMVYRLSSDKEYLRPCIDDQLQLIDRDTLNRLTHINSSTGQRCLLTARVFGDEFDVNFWTAALYFLSRARDQRDNFNDQLLLSMDDCQSLTSTGSTVETGSDFVHSSDRILLDCLQSQSCFLRQQLHRVEQHNKKRTSTEHRQKCIEHFTMMGREEEATKILLETDFQSGHYREDYLQACLMSCDRTNTTAQSTLKLVATHLIISGKLQEGVEILCLLGKVLDACKYLQTYDQWQQAAWLAKLMLNDKECEEIYLKWIEHLISGKQMLQAIFIMMSLGKFDDVLKTLLYIGYLETGVSFLKACQEHGFQLPKDESEAILEKYGSHIERLGLVVSD